MPVHTTSVTVRFHELDPYGHVNHARYLSYFETARIEALSAVGLPLDAMQQQGYLFVVVEATVKYHRPAVLGQVLAIDTGISKAGHVSSRWWQRMRHDGQDVASLELHVAVTGLDGRPKVAPSSLMASLETLTVQPATG